MATGNGIQEKNAHAIALSGSQAHNKRVVYLSYTYALRKEKMMLPIQYIGLLNTDRNRKEPITMFIQGNILRKDMC